MDRELKGRGLADIFRDQGVEPGRRLQTIEGAELCVELAFVYFS